MLWMAEGIIMQASHLDKSYSQSNLCLNIIEAILKESKCDKIYTKFREFCLTWLDHPLSS